MKVWYFYPMWRKSCFFGFVLFSIACWAVGQNLPVLSIRFDGNKSIDTVRLKAQLRACREGGWYNPQLLEMELQNLESFYRDAGFLKAKVGPASMTIQSVPEKGEAAVIRIAVSEGSLFSLGKVDIKNAVTLNTSTLLQMAPMQEGQPYSRKKISDWRAKIAEAYQSMGYLRFDSTLKEDLHDLRHTVDCTIELREGNPFRVGRILVEGDSTIDPSEFKRKLLVSEGGLFNSEMLLYSIYFINSLAKYRPISPADVETKVDDAKSTVDLTIRVTPLKKTSSQMKTGAGGRGPGASATPYESAALRLHRAFAQSAPISFSGDASHRYGARSMSGRGSQNMLPRTGRETPNNQDPQATIRTEVALVNVVFTAVDRSNRFVPGLKAEDFQVFEDKKAQKVEYFSDFSKENDVPLTIALLIDTSGSVKNKLEYEKETAAEFFRKVLRKNKDLALIIQFDSDVNLVQDFTEDAERLIRALDALHAGNSTALYDAVYLAVDEKLKAETGRKVIVVITDGEDTSSRLRKEVAIEAAQRSDVLIYGIGVRGDYGTNFGVLKRFAEDTGGMFFSPRARLDEVQSAFRAIGEDLQGQYSLAYISTNTNRDGLFRTIEIRSKINGIRVRSRKGYYAPKSR
jgi:Ca-activated chloride channel family protein